MVKDPANVARTLAALGEPTELPLRSPGRGPPYWNSRVLRRQAFGDEDDGQVPWVQETAYRGSRMGDGPRAGGACASSRIEATQHSPGKASEPVQGPPGLATARDGPRRRGLLTAGPPLYYLAPPGSPRVFAASPGGALVSMWRTGYPIG